MCLPVMTAGWPAVSSDAWPSPSVDDDVLPQYDAQAVRKRFGGLAIAEIAEQHV